MNFENLDESVTWCFNLERMTRLALAPVFVGFALSYGLPTTTTPRASLRQAEKMAMPGWTHVVTKKNPLRPTKQKSALSATATEVTGGEEKESLMETLKTGSFFGLWYLLNIGYNIYNKRALNMMDIPWTMATLQLFVGIPYVAFLWLTGLRKKPELTKDEYKTLYPISLGHLGTHIGAVISLGAGAVSFTHIVKASEPAVSAVLSAVILGAFYSPITYATLIPIIGGVALASLKELSFTWLGFGAAMLSNVSSALRGILAKQSMGNVKISEANLYAILTILSFCTLLPISLLIESPAKIKAVWDAAVLAGNTPADLTKISLLAGAYYYLYNEVAFLALGRVQPVTHAVGNTIKRVVIIIASVIAFNTAISPLGIAGSTIAISGTLLYSLAKQRYG